MRFYKATNVRIRGFKPISRVKGAEKKWTRGL